MERFAGRRAATRLAACAVCVACALVTLVAVVGSAAVVGAAGAAGTAAVPGSAATPPEATRAGWTVYHHGPQGTGAVAGPSFSSATRAWTSPVLDGQLYGEPLETGGRVFVATENDTVYALAAASGAVLWRRHLGTPVPAPSLPCTDITPTVGITGTPVIDTARHEIFVVADEMVHGTAAHELVGLDTYTGAVMLTRDVDPPGSDPLAQLQRTGLALDGGEVVFGFGGNDGDCSTYHGWVEAVPEGGGTPHLFEVDSGAGQDQGAVWMGGAAPEVDPSGNIWVAVGNGSNARSSDPYDDSDSVLELSRTLTLEQYFAPSDWYDDNGHDRDLGSSPPALVGGRVVQAGKSQTAFLANRSSLGGIGGQETKIGVCSGGDAAPGDVEGGDAVSGDVVYLPCQRGLEALRVGTSPPSMTVLWQTTSGAYEPPIVAGGLVWSMGGGTLYGLDPSTGAAVVRLGVGRPADHFPTPSVGDGLLLAPAAADTVVAFAGSAGKPEKPAAPTSTRPSAEGERHAKQPGKNPSGKDRKDK